MSYVDGFLIAVPNNRLDEYKTMAELGRTVWMDHGATAYLEAVADDVPYGEVTSFPRAVMAKEDETVIFSFIVYPSKEVRDACMKKVFEDDRMKGSMDNAPFDGKRMIFGGFDAILTPEKLDGNAGYVDGFVMPVEANRLDEYRRIAKESAPMWKDFGAVAIGETLADDAPVGELTSFPRSVQAKDGETVGFGYVIYESREHRDAVNAKMMADKRFEELMRSIPVDGKRMIFGGFRTIVHA